MDHHLIILSKNFKRCIVTIIYFIALHLMIQSCLDPGTMTPTTNSRLVPSLCPATTAPAWMICPGILRRESSLPRLVFNIRRQFECHHWVFGLLGRYRHIIILVITIKSIMVDISFYKWQILKITKQNHKTRQWYDQIHHSSFTFFRVQLSR